MAKPDSIRPKRKGNRPLKKKTRSADPPARKLPDALPDLERIIDDFADALAVVEVSEAAVARNDQSGPESITLRVGVEALNRVYDSLDKADVQLTRWREKHAKVLGRLA